MSGGGGPDARDAGGPGGAQGRRGRDRRVRAVVVVQVEVVERRVRVARGGREGRAALGRERGPVVVGELEVDGHAGAEVDGGGAVVAHLELDEDRGVVDGRAADRQVLVDVQLVGAAGRGVVEVTAGADAVGDVGQRGPVRGQLRERVVGPARVVVEEAAAALREGQQQTGAVGVVRAGPGGEVPGVAGGDRVDPSRVRVAEVDGLRSGRGDGQREACERQDTAGAPRNDRGA